MSELERLQQLLFGRQSEALENLRQRIDIPERRAADVATVLSDALQKVPEPERLSSAMAEPASEAIRVAIRRDSDRVANILYPAVLPAIRKSIEQAMQGFMESIDLLVKQQFSADSLKWRIESLRTGVPFKEIMLRNLLRYQVEQVFLIHRANGLVIGHVAMDPDKARDQDAVSGMLSAIESFVRESFADENDDGSLDRVTVGDRIVYLEHGPHTLLASVVRGVATPAYRERLRRINEEIHAAFSTQLEAYGGGSDEIPGLEGTLSQALGREFQLSNEQETRREGAGRAKRVRQLLVAAAVVAALLLAFVIHRHWFQHRIEGLQHALSAQPGIVAAVAGREDGKWVIQGLRDPAAVLPEAVAQRRGLGGNVSFRFEPYLSLAPEIVARRAQRLLNIPASLQSEVKDGVLFLTGKAPVEWLMSLNADGNLPEGVDAIDLEGVRLDPAEVDALVKAHVPGLAYFSLAPAPAGTMELTLARPPSRQQLSALEKLEKLLAPRLQTRFEP